MKNTFLFTYSTNILARFVKKELSYPKKQKMCNPILVTLLKLLPYYSQPSPENLTPSSSTSWLASYEEVPHFLLAILLSMSALCLRELTSDSQGFWHFFVWHDIYYIIVHCE